MCSCGKIEYHSKNDAWAAKCQMQAKYQDNNIYLCESCHNYHLGREKRRDK